MSHVQKLKHPYYKSFPNSYIDGSKILSVIYNAFISGFNRFNQNYKFHYRKPKIISVLYSFQIFVPLFKLYRNQSYTKNKMPLVPLLKLDLIPKLVQDTKSCFGTQYSGCQQIFVPILKLYQQQYRTKSYTDAIPVVEN